MNVFEILWNMIIQTSTWVAALNSLIFSEWFEIPGVASFSIWNMVVNPATFALLMVAVVAKKVIPIL